MANINQGLLDGIKRVSLKVRDLIIDGGVTGAPLGIRLRGATVLGTPTNGTWKVGDVIIDRAGVHWLCTVSGSPGTWTAGQLPLSGGTMAGWFAPSVTALVDGSSVPINAANGNYFTWALGAGSHTLSAPTNPVNGQAIIIAIAYSGSFTPLFNAIFVFGTDGQPTWTATNAKTDLVSFVYSTAKTQWLCTGWKLGY